MADSTIPNLLAHQAYFGSQFNSLVGVIGFRAALLLCQRYGGAEDIYIHRTPGAEHRFVDVIGPEKFSKLSAAFGGRTLKIPMVPNIASKKIAIIEALIAGKETRYQLAMRLKTSQRHVRSMASELRAAGLLPDKSDTPTNGREDSNA